MRVKRDTYRSHHGLDAVAAALQLGQTEAEEASRPCMIAHMSHDTVRNARDPCLVRWI